MLFGAYAPSFAEQKQLFFKRRNRQPPCTNVARSSISFLRSAYPVTRYTFSLSLILSACLQCSQYRRNDFCAWMDSVLSAPFFYGNSALPACQAHLFPISLQYFHFDCHNFIYYTVHALFLLVHFTPPSMLNCSIYSIGVFCSLHFTT